VYVSPSGRLLRASRSLLHAEASALPTVEDVEKFEFMDAVKASQQICATLESSPAEVPQPLLNALLSRPEGMRGFFVTFLTDESLKSLDDGKTPLSNRVKQAILAAPAMKIADIMVKNLIMSAAVEVMHRENGDLENADRSALTVRRAAKVVIEVGGSLNAVRQQLQAARAGITDTLQLRHTPAVAMGDKDEPQQGYWVGFLESQGYSDDALAASAQTVDRTYNILLDSLWGASPEKPFLY